MENAADKHSTTIPQKYMVCHDGSQSSKDALNTVHKSLLREQDNLVVAHAWCKNKEEYLKFDLKKDWIKEQNEAHFISMGKHFRYMDREILSD